MFVSLGFLGFLFALMEVYAKDHKAVAEEGFFQGYNSVVWILVTIQVLPRLYIYIPTDHIHILYILNYFQLYVY